MKFGVDVPTHGHYADPRLLAEMAHEAEEAGWDGFFLWDHIALRFGEILLARPGVPTQSSAAPAVSNIFGYAPRPWTIENPFTGDQRRWLPSPTNNRENCAAIGAITSLSQMVAMRMSGCWAAGRPVLSAITSRSPMPTYSPHTPFRWR